MILANNNSVPSRSCPQRRAVYAFSLIEVLVAVTLMSVIILGLMAMFGETQRAFRTGITQVDVMESGRAAMEMIAREIEQAEACDQGNGAFNFNVGLGSYNFAPVTLRPYRLIQDLVGTPAQRTNIIHDLTFLTREGQEWSAIGYAVVYTNFIGTLYRYETNTSGVLPDWQFVGNAARKVFYGPNPQGVRASRVIDGVVDLQVRTYDIYGQLISPDYTFRVLNPNQIQTFWGGRSSDDIRVSYLSNALPAYVEIELGILEAKTADRARAVGESSLTAQLNYLTNKVGRVQVFRQRIPIRNVDPSVYQ